MRGQIKGLVLALIALMPCVIDGEPVQNYLNEAPVDVAKGTFTVKFNVEKLHKELSAILEVLSPHLPLSKLKGTMEFKKFLESQLQLLDRPEEILYDTRDIVSLVTDVASAGVEAFGGFFGSLASGLLDVFGVKDYIVDKIGGEESKKAEHEMERELLLEAVTMVLNSMEIVLEEAFNAAVESRAANEVNHVAKDLRDYWQDKLRILRKQLGVANKQ